MKQPSSSSNKGSAFCTVLCAGANSFGQLGLGNAARRPDSSTPVAFGQGHLLLQGHRQVACGSQFTVVVDRNGQVYLCGTLNGVVMPLLTPITIPFAAKCVQVACGRKHILGLLDGGYVVSWGVGYFGQLGLGDESCWDTPQMVHALMPTQLGSDRVAKIGCGCSHSFAITTLGRLFMWGLNKSGQCGTSEQGDTVSSPRPVDVPIGVKMAAAGRTHSAALTQTGLVYTWGSSMFGKLGLKECGKTVTMPSPLNTIRGSPIQSISSGDNHMVALAEDRTTVYCWGFGADGQDGIGNQLHVRTPTKVFAFDRILEMNAKVCGREIFVQQIVAGPNWSFAILSNGALYGWGYADGGWLGIPVDNNTRTGRLPVYDSDTVNPSIPHGRIASFDSRLNCLVPQLITSITEKFNVLDVACGGGHSVFSVMARTPNDLYYDNNEDDTAEESVETSTKMGASSPRSMYNNTVAADAAASSKDNHNNHQATESSEASAVMVDQFLSWCRHRKLADIKQTFSNVSSSMQRDFLECRDRAGNTPLLVACQNGHKDVAAYLIANGAAVNAANDKGNTALHFCMSYGFHEAASLLLANGADEFATNKEGLTCYEGLSLADLENL